MMILGSFFEIEDGSQQFLYAVQNATQDQEIKENFTSLIDHKIAHKKSLTLLFEKIAGQAVGDDFPTGVLQNPPHKVMAGCVSVPEADNWSKDKKISEILDLLVAFEANTFDLYLKLGRQVESDQARSVFMQLSEEEARHLEQLASNFEKTL